MYQLRHKKLSPLRIVYQKNGELGIDNIKLVLTVIITFLVDVLTIIRTKNWIRLVEIVFSLTRYGNIVDIAKDALKELKDVSQEESQQIYEHFSKEFDLENDTTEMLIEQAISTIPRIYQLIIDGLDLVGTGREIYQEISFIFNKEGELVELSDRLNKAA